MATSGDRNLAIDIQEAAEYGYTSVGSSQWAAAMIAYYDGDFTKADSRWTMLPSTQWSDGQPLKDVIYWLDLARVRRAAGHLAEARELLDRLDVTLRQFVNPRSHGGVGRRRGRTGARPLSSTRRATPPHTLVAAPLRQIAWD